MPRPFRFGVVTGGAPSREAWIALARKAEDLGYATLLMPDRPSFGSLAPLTALAVAATATTTLRVGSHVFSNELRHPALLAKEIVTLDLLSEGRVELGIGAGVGPRDSQQLGMPFGDPGERISRLFEAIRVIKAVFTDETVHFTGKYYTVAGLTGLPRPYQQPHPPIFIGSTGKRMLTFAAREADTIAPVVRMTAQGQDPADTPLADKIGWIREAAGERFAQVELAQTAFGIAISESLPPTFPQIGGMAVVPRSMTIAQTVEHLLAQREQLGISYLQVFEGQMDNFAPVVARLAGQ